MKLKSYFSGTVEAAMELARQELGDEALLINARPATPETRYLGAYEVVFGIPPQAVERPTPQKALLERLAPARQTPAAEPLRIASPDNRTEKDTRPENRLADDVADLKRGFSQLMEALAAGGMVNPPAPSAVNLWPEPIAPAAPELSPFKPAAPSASSALYTHLLSQDLDPGLAQAVAEGTPLDDFFQVDASLGRPGAARSIVALVGPPGVGKTTTLVKLAARYGLTARRPVQILSTDVYRIAAADQLRSLAAILGIGFDVAETAGALAQLLEEHRSKELIFVDTPGLTRTEMEDAGDLAAFLSAHNEIDTHLVVPISMRPADLARTIDRYGIFQPQKLLFTRIDETTQYGPLVGEAHRTRLPLSFLATGQQIPDDLEPAETSRILDLILGPAFPSQEVSSPAPHENQPHRKGASA